MRNKSIKKFNQTISYSSIELKSISLFNMHPPNPLLLTIQCFYTNLMDNSISIWVLSVENHFKFEWDAWKIWL